MEELHQSAPPSLKAERRRLKKEKKRLDRQLVSKNSQRKKFLLASAWILGAVVLVFIISFVMSKQKILPPTTMAGHIEVSPQSHFTDRPMDIRVHKHMLEHADGSGPPGVIINYNCDDFDCESNLLDKLKEIVDQYPQNVYVAPYRNMSAKLVLTRLDRQKILDGFVDEEIIKAFISEVAQTAHTQE